MGYGRFFVLRRYRRDGVGTEVARQIWSRYTGRWEVRVMEANKAALAFWACAIKSALNQPISPVRVHVADRVWFVFELVAAQGR